MSFQGESSVTGRHILVIDDDKFILQLTGDILTEAGYRVSTAQDVLYCNDIIYGKSPPDLIIMDINLPFMTGDHKVRIMKKRAVGSQIPVILFSSMEGPELEKMAADCGADGFLTKPVDDKMLLETVGRILRSTAPSSS